MARLATLLHTAHFFDLYLSIGGLHSLRSVPQQRINSAQRYLMRMSVCVNVSVIGIGVISNVTAATVHTGQTHGSTQTSTPQNPTDSPTHARTMPRGMTPVAHPAADSEEAAPCEPDPAPSRSQSASPRLLKGGRRNEGARCRRERPAVRPEHPMSSSDARGGDGVCYGCGEADEVLATTRLFPVGPPLQLSTRSRAARSHVM